jgi:hypothetical protein
MNRIEPKTLEVGQLAWYVEYQGDSKPPSQTLVKMLVAEPKLTVQNVLTGETFEPYPMYTYFEPVHPQYIENQIKALEQEQLRVALVLATYKTL